MVSHIQIEVLESIVRSFDTDDFTTENVTAAMRNYPPRHRTEPRLTAGLLTRLGLAESVERIAIQCPHRWKMTTVWRRTI